MGAEVVWIVLIICTAIVASLKTLGGRRKQDASPREILARRYAAGEISEAEYVTKLSFLKDANELTP